MELTTLTNLLARTLEDHRLSRGEKQVLQDAFVNASLDEQQLATCRHAAFELVRRAVSDGEVHKLLDWLQDVSRVLQQCAVRTAAGVESEAYFSPGDNCPQRIVSLLDAAVKSVDICVFTITDDRISSAILAAQRRGIPVLIITDDEKIADPGSDIQRLQQAGIPVRVDRSMYHMHHKFALFDNAKLLTGSYNWTRGAAENNMENFLVTNERKLVARYATVFDGIWNKLA
jgi:phosphatidylserine/phosphatidylglycerophosphate/cardiolipin synthase-like enzyme